MASLILIEQNNSYTQKKKRNTVNDDANFYINRNNQFVVISHLIFTTR